MQTTEKEDQSRKGGVTRDRLQPVICYIEEKKFRIKGGEKEWMKLAIKTEQNHLRLCGPLGFG